MGDARELSEEMVILLAAMEAKREDKGRDWCKHRGIGRWREIIGRPADNVTALNGRPAADGQRKAAEILAAHCRLCGRCSLSRL